MTILQLSKIFRENLKEKCTSSEISWLFSVFVEEILNLNKIEQKISSEKEISSEQEAEFLKIISELQTGKPYQQILGRADFFGETFLINENVLVPRPETEELLEIAIKTIQRSTFNTQNFKIIDIGTGSGIIPIILKKKFPTAHIFSIDISEKALEIAEKNAFLHQTKISFLQKDFLKDDSDENFDIIISNPPYIGLDEKNNLDENVLKYEPESALFPFNEDPLIFYRKIAEFGQAHLNENGLIFLEINQKYGIETLNLYRDFSESELIKDISGNDRFIVVKK